ncbi:MAG: hypothetical protein G8237_11055 [Magnetococcales bacterium]|nr:SPOR domain-containing protein [Magnetococcales bacterium]NGZ06881.1 hypothetical protein [Magnetococcales bacterium]
MNPRYPTSKQFRRHRNRKLGRPLLVLGLLAGVVLYWIFSSSPPPRQSEMASPSESKALEEEIAAHLKTTQPALAAPAAESRKESAAAGSAPESKPETRKLALIDSPSLTDPTARFEAQENPLALDEAVTPAPTRHKGTPGAVPVKKGAEGAGKPVDSKSRSHEQTKTTPESVVAETESKTNKDLKETKETKETKESEDPPMPSAPKELAPKAKPPDLDITFYRELAKKKVVVPLEEPLDGTPVKPATLADGAARQAATPEKSAAKTGNYVVQLGVFNDAQRAATMVGELHKRGVPARVVKNKEGTLFRVRVGPFPTHAEATRSVTQWKLGGQSTLIFQDHEG